MDFAVEGVLGVPKGEHSAARSTYRTGYREREWHTRLGTLELKSPKLRTGSYFPSVLAPRRRSQRALTAVVPEA
jgi:transposase-like protein